MKKLLNIFLITLIVISTLTLTGCNDQYSVYLFTSSGGYITLNDSIDRISLKEILYCNNQTDITLNANEHEGYHFLYWIKDAQVYSTEKSISLSINKETVIKAIFENNQTLSITFVDENYKLIKETTLSIQFDEIMKNFPPISQKSGFVANYYCENEKMIEGNKYPFNTSKTFVLKYIKEQFAVSFEYINCIESDININLLTESFTVGYNGTVKFTINSNNKNYKVYLSSTFNEIYADAYGIYSLTNITENKKIIIKVI